MGRILAIDYGRKRVGLAITDPFGNFAQGLETVPSHTAIDYLKKYDASVGIELFVVGKPKTLANEDSESVRYLKPFLAALKKAFPQHKIVSIDERFTSKLAFGAMIDAGLKKKDRQNKELVDTISATIILQSYLEQKENNLL